MNGNTELLNFVYQNSGMGVETLKQLVNIAKDTEFLHFLTKQLNEYESIHEKTKELINSHGSKEKDLPMFEKMSTYLMINMKTLTDNSASHIAEMLVLGSNMGIVDAIKNMRKYKDAEKDILSLMDRLLKFEESNVKELKKYL